MAISGINTNRITGLATGMDTDQVVKNMLKAHKIKVDRFKQKKQVDEWKQETYVELTQNLRKLKSDYMDIVKSGDNNLLLNSTYSTLKNDILEADRKNLDVKGSIGAIQGNYKVKVNNLASNASIHSNLPEGTKLDVDKPISDYIGAVGEGQNENLKITVGDDVFEFNMNSDMTLGDFLKELKNTTVKDSNGNSKSLSSVLNIGASTITNKIVFQTVKTGSNSSIKVEGSIAEKLGMSSGLPVEAKGTDAEIEVKIPGETEYSKVTSESNLFTRDNITFALKEADSTKEISFNLRPDATEVAGKVEKFINSYNELVKKIEDLLSEKTTGYKPLTDEEKDSLSEKQIEKWENQAKKGLFRNDKQLESMILSLRRAFSDGIEGVSTDYRKIGIDTKKDSNTITFDKDKFKTAFEVNGEEIFNLLTKDTKLNINYESTANEKRQAYNERGIFRRISSILDEYAGGEGVFVKKAGFENSRYAFENDLTKSILKQEKAIAQMENKMFNKEKVYYSQFAKLEEAMNKLNAQSNWLASQLGGIK
ncbi:flagellar hook-associated protein 2 [Hathewaya proteolytica DSM 3090]|uniref:Flagellar hook-associated protein 2 n=1 Tax=Hathewaya proteolytica DSM 3090 TaxID=1121331 RepID=A0A1M6LB96_9CLOT|nr:flagellar filament capping protein FliD [Hathewaya proteolytica]SHJ68490.1 flagellar hook-associated protein 2 [Hathewaya proteolytica DSM 3090]